MRFIILLSLLLFGSEVMAAAYCPTNAQVQEKSRYFQLKALNMMSSQSSSMEEADALLKEQDNYIKSMVYGCLEYFKTSKAPDCNRLGALTTGYIMMDSSQKPAVKNQIYSILQNLPQSCESAIYATKMMIK